MSNEKNRPIERLTAAENKILSTTPVGGVATIQGHSLEVRRVEPDEEEPCANCILHDLSHEAYSGVKPCVPSIRPDRKNCYYVEVESRDEPKRKGPAAPRRGGRKSGQELKAQLDGQAGYVLRQLFNATVVLQDMQVGAERGTDAYAHITIARRLVDGARDSLGMLRELLGVTPDSDNDDEREL